MTLFKHKDLVTLDYGVKPMRDREDSSAFELLCDEFLDGLLSNDIDVSSCLIEQNYLVVFEYSSYDAEELFLADSKVTTVFSHFEVKS